VAGPCPSTVTPSSGRGGRSEGEAAGIALTWGCRRRIRRPASRHASRRIHSDVSSSLVLERYASIGPGPPQKCGSSEQSAHIVMNLRHERSWVSSTTGSTRKFMLFLPSPCAGTAHGLCCAPPGARRRHGCRDRLLRGARGGNACDIKMLRPLRGSVNERDQDTIRRPASRHASRRAESNFRSLLALRS